MTRRRTAPAGRRFVRIGGADPPRKASTPIPRPTIATPGRLRVSIPARFRLFAVLLPLNLLSGCEPVDPALRQQAPEAAAVVDTSGADAPPALEIGHTLGSADAPVTVMEFSDFGCDACAGFARESLPSLKREFVETGQVRWRFVAIRQGFFRG